MAHRFSARFLGFLAFLLASWLFQSAHAVTSAEGFIARAMIISDLPDPVAEKLWDGIRVPLQSVIRAFGRSEFSFQSRGVYSSMSLLLSRCRTDENEAPPSTFSDRCVTRNIDMSDVPYATAVILQGTPPRWTFEVHVYALAGKRDPLVFSVLIEADGQPELTAGLRATLDFASVELSSRDVALASSTRLPPERGVLLLVDPRSGTKEGYVLVDKKHEKSIDVEHPVFLPGVTSVTIRRINTDNSVLEDDVSTGLTPTIVVRNVRPIPRKATPISVEDTVLVPNQMNWWTPLSLDRKAGVVIGGLGLLVGGVSTYLFFDGIAQEEKSQDTSLPYKEATDLYKNGRDFQGIGFSGMIAGGGLVLVGAALFIWEPLLGPRSSESQQKNENPPAGIVPLDDGAAFYAKFRF